MDKEKPTFRGLKDKCPQCGSTNLEQMSRVTGYYSKIGGWNKSKKRELKDRFRSGRYFGMKPKVEI